MFLIAYMSPYSLETNISSSYFLHFWRGNSRKSQNLAWAAFSVPSKADPAATNSEFCWMQGPATECGLSIGFYVFLLSIQTNRVLSFRVCLGLCPPGQNSGISNSSSGVVTMRNTHCGKRTPLTESVLNEALSTY